MLNFNGGIIRLKISLVVFLMTYSAMAVAAVPLEVIAVAPARPERRGVVDFADFGQAAYANVEITFPADVPTATVTVRLGEKLAADGTIDRKPPGSVIFREVKLQTMPGQRTYRLTLPHVKRHDDPAAVHLPPELGDVTPFRYIEIEGSPVALDQSSLRQRVVRAPFDASAAGFECSDETLNAVWRLCHHTIQATTTFGVYIDGDRERIPYEADAYINQLSHYALDLDPRVARATFEHLLKHPTWPTEWSLHMPMIAAADYQATGDPVLAATHYEALKRTLLSDRARSDGLLKAYAIVDWPVGERDGYNDGQLAPHDNRQIGPEVNTVVNAFYYHAFRQMAVLAKATGRAADAAKLETTAAAVYESFQRVFFDASRGIYIDGEGSGHASLHANMFALAFELVPAERQSKVADFIESRGMACSVYGAQYLLDALYAAGRDDSAVRLMTARGDRSWWHMIEQGSTMTLEAWNAKVKPNLTWNHAWGAVPANVIARHVLGVRPLTPGYASVQIQPQLGELTWIKGKVPTPLGAVTVEADSAANFEMTFVIPAGMNAHVILPAEVASDVVLDEKAYTAQSDGKRLVVGPIGEGKHRLVAPFAKSKP